MADIEELSEEDKTKFCEIIDEAILESTGEMREGFQMLDELARSLKKTFYEIIFDFYEADEVRRQVKDWDKEKEL